MTNTKQVFCCGSVAYDLVIVSKTTGREFNIKACPGGSVFNTAAALARYGVNVSLIANLAEDFLGDEFVGILLEEGISPRFVSRDSRIKTGLAIARINKKGESSYVFYRSSGPETAIPYNTSLLSSFKKGDVFHTGSAFTYADHSHESVLKIMRSASDRGVFVTYDPNWREGRVKNKSVAKARIKKFLDLANLIRLNETDAMEITGQKTLTSALKKLPERAILTMGKKGSFYWNGKKSAKCPAPQVKVVDTIGAGDAFTAGIIYRYCIMGEDGFWRNMRKNLEFASHTAALVCSEHGAIAGLKRSLIAEPDKAMPPMKK